MTPYGRTLVAWYGLVALVVLGTLLPARADWSGRVYNYDRHTYRSPSGQASVTVDPVDRYGLEGADYLVKRKGRVLWGGRRAFSLYEAVVGDDGSVGGYCFIRREDLPRERGAPFVQEFHVVVLAPDGKVRLDEATRLVDSRIPDEEPHPDPAGLFLQPDADRMVVRVHAANASPGGEDWWPYRLSTGTPFPHFQPLTRMSAGDARYRLVAAKPVMGTPLTLIQWRRYERTRSDGARFTLVDPEGFPKWQLDLPHDYEPLARASAQRDRVDDLVSSGEVIRAPGRDRFSVGIVRARKRAQFAVSLTGDAHWEVREVSRMPWNPFPSPLPIPEKKLRLLGSVVLREPGTREPAVRNIVQWTFAGPGRFAILREGVRDPAALVLIDANGRTREVGLHSIPRQPGSNWSAMVWSSDDRFLVTRSVDRLSCADGWWVDVAHRTIEPVQSFASPVINRILRFPDGAFAVVSGRTHAFASIRLFHSDATLAVPELVPDTERKDDPLRSVRGVSITSDGRLVVMDEHERIALFNELGARLTESNLESERADGKVFRRDANGEVPVHGFAGSSSDLWCRLMGHDLPTTPRFPNGMTATARDFMCASDGGFWGADGHSLLRTDRNGRIDRVIGAVPNRQRLEQPGVVSVGADNRIYAIDERTGSVHAFDPQGRRVHIYPATHPSGYVRPLFGPTVSAGRTGDIWVGPDALGHYSRFSRDGRLVQSIPYGKPVMGLGGPAERRLCTPEGKNLWIVDQGVWTVDPGVRLVRPDSSTIGQHDRRPDGTWLTSVMSFAVSPTGALGALEWNGGDPEGRAIVSVYGSDGAPQHTLRVPIHDGFPESLALDDRRVFLAGRQGVIVADMAARPVWRFRPPFRGSSRPIEWQVFVARDGHELWLYDEDRTVYRYALPGTAAGAPRRR